MKTLTILAGLANVEIVACDSASNDAVALKATDTDGRNALKIGGGKFDAESRAYVFESVQSATDALISLVGDDIVCVPVKTLVTATFDTTNDCGEEFTNLVPCATILGNSDINSSVRYPCLMHPRVGVVKYDYQWRELFSMLNEQTDGYSQSTNHLIPVNQSDNGEWVDNRVN